jgi:hypothetical protein
MRLIEAAWASVLARQTQLPASQPEIAALVLLAVAHGLGSLAIDTESECEHMYTEAAKLVFDRMTASEISHLG